MSYYMNAVALRMDIDGAAEMLTDAQAAAVPGIYYPWSGAGILYAEGDRRTYNGVLYRCITGHTSQPGWNPADSTGLWTKVLIPDPSVIPEWEQPDSTNPYSKGDKVRHNGKTWTSDIDGNVWEPGVYGWTEVTE